MGSLVLTLLPTLISGVMRIWSKIALILNCPAPVAGPALAVSARVLLDRSFCTQQGQQQISWEGRSASVTRWMPSPLIFWANLMKRDPIHSTRDLRGIMLVILEMVYSWVRHFSWDYGEGPRLKCGTLVLEPLFWCYPNMNNHVWWGRKVPTNGMGMRKKAWEWSFLDLAIPQQHLLSHSCATLSRIDPFTSYDSYDSYGTCLKMGSNLHGTEQEY